MGFAKQREIEQWEQAWNYSDRTICWRCLSHDYLRNLVKQEASETECSSCERTGRKPIAIPFNRLGPPCCRT